MYCKHCGTEIKENAKFCTSCGGGQDGQGLIGQEWVQRQMIGYSDRINDPQIAAALKKINSSSMIFALVLAIVAVIVFTVLGLAEVGDFELPSAFFIGLSIGGMLIVIGLIQKAKAKKDKTWDGTIVDKKIKQPTYTQRQNGNYKVEYVLYINDQYGKIKKIPCNKGYFEHMQIGEQVRHHGGTPDFSFEKYDKSKDSIIYCIVCTSKNDINKDVCYKCKCPLLK